MSGAPWDERDVRVVTFGLTDVGRQRTHNEDSFLIAELREEGDEAPRFRQDSLDDTPALDRAGEFAIGPTGALLVVADGMGGAAAGEVASALAVETVLERMEEDWLPERARTADRFAFHLVRAVEEANGRIHRRARKRESERGMGCTITVVGLFDGHAYAAQVGDSRAYVVRDGTATQITRDQTVVQQMIEAGALRAEDAEESRYRHVILQALGTEPEVEVEVTYHPLRRGDALLLCSDGLSGPVDPDTIADTVAARPDPVEVCRTLVGRANDEGGPDNITAVAAYFDGSGLEAPGDGDGVELRPLQVREP